MQLAHLNSSIEGGKPLQQREAQDTYTTADLISFVEYEGMEWTRQMVSIMGLDMLNVRAYLHLCPPPSNFKGYGFLCGSLG